MAMDLFKLFSFLCPLCSFWQFSCGGSLTPVTSDVIGANQRGIVAAFGDLNADKLVDILILNDEGV